MIGTLPGRIQCSMIGGMRTTLDIDDDVLRAADQLSAREQKPPGKLISEWARRGIRDSAREHSGPLVLNGFEILPAQGRVVTNELVRQLLDEGEGP